MILRGDAGTGIRHTYLDRIRATCRLPAALSRYGWLTGGSPFPHVGLRVQPDCATLGSKLGCIFQQIGNYTLRFGRIEWKRTDFFIGQEIKGEAAFLKTRRPETANL